MIWLALSVAPRVVARCMRLLVLSALGLAIAGLPSACTSSACAETLTCFDPSGEGGLGKEAAPPANDGSVEAGVGAFNVPDVGTPDAPGADAPIADAPMADAPMNDGPTTDGPPTDASEAGDAPPTCPGANLMSDPANCGRCNHACGANLVCSSGVCAGDLGIRCASGTPACAPGTQECCLAADNSLSCIPSGTFSACRGGADITCDDKADCPGQLCCIDLDWNNSLLGASCRLSCTGGRRGGGTRLELCAAGAGTCTTGTCQPLLKVIPSPPLSPGWFSACQ